MARQRYLAPALLVLQLMVLWLAIPAPARAETALELAQRVQQRYRQIETLRADYQRVSRFKALSNRAEDQLEGSGQLSWARPLKLRLDQKEPRPELVLADGKQVWWVRTERQRADVYPLSDFTGGLNSLLEVLQGLANIEQDFHLVAPEMGEAESAPAGSLALVLKPKVQRADLDRLTLYVDSQSLLLRGFLIQNLLGDTTRYVLDHLETNFQAEADLFGWAPPAGWQVRDHRPVEKAN